VKTLEEHSKQVIFHKDEKLKFDYVEGYYMRGFAMAQEMYITM